MAGKCLTKFASKNYKAQLITIWRANFVQSGLGFIVPADGALMIMEELRLHLPEFYAVYVHI